MKLFIALMTSVFLFSGSTFAASHHVQDFIKQKKQFLKDQNAKLQDDLRIIEKLEKSLKNSRKKMWLGFTWRIPVTIFQAYGTVTGADVLVEMNASFIRSLFSITTGTTLLTGKFVVSPMIKSVKTVRKIKRELNELRDGINHRISVHGEYVKSLNELDALYKSDKSDEALATFLNEKREKYKAQGKKVLDGVKAIDDLRESLKKARKKKWIGFTWQVPALAAQTVGTIVGGSLLIEYYSGLRRLFSITTGTTLLTGFVAGKPFFKNIREVKALKSDLSRLEMEFERDLAQNAKNRAIVEQFSKAVNAPEDAPEDAMIPSSDWYKMPEAI